MHRVRHSAELELIEGCVPSEEDTKMKMKRIAGILGIVALLALGSILSGCASIGTSQAVATAAQRGANQGKLCRAEYWHSSSLLSILTLGLISDSGGREVFVGDGEPCPRDYVAVAASSGLGSVGCPSSGCPPYGRHGFGWQGPTLPPW